MKTVFVFFLLVFWNLALLAQNLCALPDNEFIPSINLQLTTGKTTHLVFPYKIETVDRGSRDVLAQKVPGVENVLQLKAARVNFCETNLTVITIDGMLYSFTITYSPVLQQTIYRINKVSPDLDIDSQPAKALLEGRNSKRVEIQSNCAAISGFERTIWGVSKRKCKSAIKLIGLYYNEAVLYCQIELSNRSNLDYELDQVRFYVKDKKQGKRTAIQEIELFPLYQYGEIASIPGNNKRVIVVALEKFTIPDKKIFALEIKEKNGGRHLYLQINNNQIIQSKVLP